jgi:hypothetical protein
MITGCPDDDTLVSLECSPGEVRACDENGETVENLSSLTRNGICTYGQQHCTFDGWGECIGAQGPEEEVCDGIDNDCNGAIDDNYPEKNQLCGFIEGVNYSEGICQPGVYECNEGALSCEGHVGPAEEVCDGIDNNCSGEIDEHIVNQTAVVCYDGPAGTMRVGICRAGISYCTDSVMSHCEGQVLPEEERCDGIDNNCDGQIDEGFEERPAEIVFVVDVSGSFSDEISSMIGGITPLLSDPITGGFKFGLVVIGMREPDRDPDSGYLHLIKVTDLVPRDEFLRHLQTIETVYMPNSGGLEPSYDAVVGICNGDISFSFSENSQKIIVLMTDEAGQSYMDPRNTEVAAADAVRDGEFGIYVFSLQEHFNTFDQIVRDLGDLHSAASDPNTVFTQLQTMFDEICR